MANEKKDIGEIVKKCKILLLDIEGTTTSISFVKEKLFPYAEENVKQFLDSQWESDDVKGAVSALRKLALEDKEKNVDGVVAIPGEDASKEDQIEGLVNSVKWQMSSDRKAGPLKLLQGLIWKQGYDSGDIKGHVYDDVLPALEQWRATEGQKIYIYSSGSVDAQKLLFGQSLAGDLLPHIDGHFDTAVGAKQEAVSYVKIAEKIGCQPAEILFLTDILKEAEAARESGLEAALVSREGNASLPDDTTFPVIHSLQQLAVTNKRKPDPQEEIPAKVPKTDIEDDVKTNVELEEKIVSPAPTENKETENKETEKPETMEVEETPLVEETKEEKVKELPMETVVEEILDAKEAIDVPVVDAEPIITEEKDKTDENETEKMEAETIETKVSDEPKESTDIKNGDVSEPVAEETPPTIITEIEDITEKPDLANVGEKIDDIEPVIEEPPAVEDMEDLQNVGEVLEKECDEILSKVQDVTNLDNIPVKPLLNPIAEETLEAGNADSNDIVDRILDTELELEMKQCEDIDLNTVQEITDAKSEAVEEKSEKEESSTDDAKVPEEKAPEVVESNNVTDGNAVSSPKETKAETKTEESTPKAEDKTPEVESKEAVETKPSEEQPAAKAEVVEEPKVESESQVNGNVTNGDAAPANVNGDASKDEELSSRLSVEENGKVEVNGGANGNANGASHEDSETEKTTSKDEVPDIKVKTVAVDEPRTDPIEQPTEA
ncbi:unnamed protein product [Chilo suppressalis]|uniref:Enolase-phosphatase E1 n=1 Tax=Chilo suppressalis TaxID=168631 RepID=A0ABN8AWC6_CHISP|nr:unnamed protein product [Chilo suppressalis]